MRVAIAVLTAPLKPQYFARWIANANGWHTEYESVHAYTFDAVDPRSRLATIVQHVELLNHSAGRAEKSVKTSLNLQTHAFKLAYERDPTADFYMVVDDDTYIVRSSLLDLLRPLNASRPHLLGKCTFRANMPPPFPRMIYSAVGGSGILMSGALVRALMPHFDDCRAAWHSMAAHSDMRVGQCAGWKVPAIAGLDTCLKPSFKHAFTNNPVEQEMRWRLALRKRLAAAVRGAKPTPKEGGCTKHNQGCAMGDRVVGLHEKDPERLGRIHAFVQRLERRGVPVTWSALVPLVAELCGMPPRSRADQKEGSRRANLDRGTRPSESCNLGNATQEELAAGSARRCTRAHYETT